MKTLVVFACVALAGAVEAQLFAPPEVYVATHIATPRAVVADFTGDGIVDIAIDATDATTSAIDVYPTNGSGGVLPPIRSAYVNGLYTPGQEPTFLIGAADFNQDGLIDLVTTTACTGLAGSLRLHLNVGMGHFAQHPMSAAVVGGGMGGAVVADLDGNGTPEIIVCNGITNTLVYSVSGSPPVFTTVATLPGPSGLVAVGDFNGDGAKDIAVARAGLLAGSGDVIVFVQGTALSFTAMGPFSTGYIMPILSCDPFPNFWLVASDVDGDGNDDLLIQHTTELPRVLPGHPGAILGAVLGPSPSSYSLQGGVEPFAGDFDSDGIGEVIIGALIWRIPPAFSMPAGLVLPLLYTPSGTAIPAVAAVDLDGDGDRDLIYAEGTVLAIARGRTVRTPACVTGGTGPGFPVGSAYLGNSGYGVGLTGLQPGAPAVLGVSFGPGFTVAGPCVAAIDLDPNALVIPAGSLGFTSANAAGVASVALPIPYHFGLYGLSFYAQWLAADPSGPWSIGGTSYLLSMSRTIVIW